MHVITGCMYVDIGYTHRHRYLFHMYNVVISPHTHILHTSGRSTACGGHTATVGAANLPLPRPGSARWLSDLQQDTGACEGPKLRPLTIT